MSKYMFEATYTAEGVKGIGHGEMCLAAQCAAALVPMQGGEGELVGGDGATHEHGNFTECAEILVWQQIGHALLERSVQDVAEGAVLHVVRRHEDDGSGEIRVAHGR